MSYLSLRQSMVLVFLLWGMIVLPSLSHGEKSFGPALLGKIIRKEIPMEFGFEIAQVNQITANQYEVKLKVASKKNINQLDFEWHPKGRVTVLSPSSSPSLRNILTDQSYEIVFKIEVKSAQEPIYVRASEASTKNHEVVKRIDLNLPLGASASSSSGTTAPTPKAKLPAKIFY